MKTNAPRLVTIALALALTLAGLFLTGTVDWKFIGDGLDAINLTGLGKDEGYLALLASPLLLIAGSFLPNL